MAYVEEWVQAQRPLEETEGLDNGGQSNGCGILESSEPPCGQFADFELPTSGIEACLDDYLPLAPNIYDYWPGDDEDHVEPWKFGEESLNIAPAQMHIDSSVEYHPPELVTSTQTSHEVERSAPHRHYLTLTY